MNAIILSIGDELVLGQTVDSNSAWLSRELMGLGIPVRKHLTVADDRSAIAQAIAALAHESELLLVTGGLGPTQDDLTRHGLADALGVELVLDDESLARVEGFFRKIGRPMPRMNQVQAMIPRGAAAMENANGTAPGISARMGKTRIFVMPGVPSEMMEMFRRKVAPEISGAGGFTILTRTLHTFGAGESTVGERLGKLMARDRNPVVGTTVSEGIVSLRIRAEFADPKMAEAEMEKTQAACREALGDLIFGKDEQTLASVVGAMLAERGWKVTTAESCTGGLLAKLLTDVPGSSRYVERGWITYSNRAKTDLLGVAADLIERHGAVNEEVVIEMAKGAMQRAGANIALSISGVAGPDGGTEAKPVGMVCIGVGRDAAAWARTFRFPGDRKQVRDRAAKMAMALLRFEIMGVRPPF